MNKEKPLVSVCVVTYNHASYIEQCLDSILMQITDFPFEIILGEDESTDGTREICIEYVGKYPDKIRLFLRSRKDVIYINGTPTGRYNFTENFKAAKGKYIALCEGDDYWTDPLKLQKQVDFLKGNSDFGICFHNVKVIGDGKPKNVNFYSDFPWCKLDTFRNVYTIIDLLKSPLMPTGSVVFLNVFDNNFPSWYYKVMSGDMALFSLIIGKRKIRFINEDMGCYRKHSSGITVNHRSDDIHINRIFMYRKLNKHLHNEYQDIIEEVIKEHRKALKGRINKLKTFF